MLNPTAPFSINRETLDSNERLSVRVGRSIRLVRIENIAYVRAAGDYIDITMNTGETVHTKSNLTQFLGKLSEHLFIKVHKSFVINKEHIKEIKSRQNVFDLTLSNNKIITSGPTYRKYIREQFLTNKRGDIEVIQNRSVRHGSDLPKMAISPEQHFYNTDNIHLRKCVVGDERMLSLLGLVTFMETHLAIHPEYVGPEITAYSVNRNRPSVYRKWLEDSLASIWVVETKTHGVPIGFLTLTAPSAPVINPRSYDLEIQRIYVTGRYRANGLYEILMTAAIRYAKQKGCRRLLLADCESNELVGTICDTVGFRMTGKYQFHVGIRQYDEVIFALEI